MPQKAKQQIARKEIAYREYPQKNKDKMQSKQKHLKLLGFNEASPQ